MIRLRKVITKLIHNNTCFKFIAININLFQVDKSSNIFLNMTEIVVRHTHL